jgi:hypothetical protein
MRCAGTAGSTAMLRTEIIAAEPEIGDIRKLRGFDQADILPCCVTRLVSGGIHKHGPSPTPEHQRTLPVEGWVVTQRPSSTHLHEYRFELFSHQQLQLD